ncbi:MAG: thiamine phosphate synthase [Helicobacteraceae bacterium]|nr:thiamine phosphate synthase [Candidatus Sulfurimonas ponti]MBL6973684.1 thiamine phosphate synthase [Sulfurimonas sp.]
MKKYLITSSEFYTDAPEIFREKLLKQIQIHQPQYALFRDKTTSNYELLAEIFIAVCKEFKNLKSFLHRDISLAQKLGATGVHLTSTQFSEIPKAKENKLEVIISTHSHEEVLKAQDLGADAVTYSPIFFSPNKGEPKGIEDLKTLLAKCEIKVFALGGIISTKQIELLEETESYGFASIRCFYNNFPAKAPLAKDH